MGVQPHYFVDVLILLTGLTASLALFRWTSALSPHRKYAARAALAFAVLLMLAGTACAAVRVSRRFDHTLVAWVRCLGLFAAAGLAYGGVTGWMMRRGGLFDKRRRKFLKLATAAAVSAPAALATFAIIRREDLTFREVELRVPALPHDLHGLRIAQLTDIHLSPFVDLPTLSRAVGMANETRPHLTLVTGDLISTKGDPLDACIRELSHLRADAGLFGCLGNHERYADAEDYTERQGSRIGLRFLRAETSMLRFGSARLNLAGVDYQRKGRRYLPGMESFVRPGAYNVLLSHNPDVFPVAARQGYDLTIAGHTHGGQVTLEMVHPSLNVMRFFTPYVYGTYSLNGRQMYVSRGIGTIGVPARLGAPPEVALLRLCAI